MRVVWERDLHGPTSQEACLGSDVTLVAERRTKLACLDSVTGSERWVANIDDVYGTPVRCGDRAVYLEKSGLVRCFELETGAEVWVRRLASRPAGNGVDLGDGAVLVGGWRGYTALASLSLADGAILWQDRRKPVADVPRPIVLGAHVVVVDPVAARIDLLDRRSGQVMRTIPMPTASPSVREESGEMVVVGSGLAMCRAGVLWVWDAATEEWAALGESVSRRPISAGEVTVIAQSRGAVVGYDTNGAEAWTIDLHASGPISACALSMATVVGGPLGQLVVVDRVGGARGTVTVGQRIHGLGRSAADTVLVAGKGTVAALEV